MTTLRPVPLLPTRQQLFYIHLHKKNTIERIKGFRGPSASSSTQSSTLSADTSRRGFEKRTGTDNPGNHKKSLKFIIPGNVCEFLPV